MFTTVVLVHLKYSEEYFKTIRTFEVHIELNFDSNEIFKYSLEI